MSLAKTVRNARNAVVAEAALAFARDRLGVAKPRRRRPGVKTLLFGALAAGGLAVVLKRGKVRALLPGRADEPAPPEPTYTPPPVSNYDAAGPVANTATAVPVPPAQEQQAGVDEAAEEAAAAAEAANIGGPDPDYAGAEQDEPATEAEAPLAEAGEGESEGAEQADAELAEPADATGEAGPEAAANDGEWRTWSGRSINP
jgi:hypothetical protein